MREWIFQKPDSFETDAKHDAYCVGEIVRCKDCRSYFKGECLCGCLPICGDTASMSIMTDPNDFCSYGERREDGENDGKA